MPRELLAWYEPLTPLSFLHRIAYVMPDKVAVICEDRRWTWREFFNRVNRLSNALKSVGVKKGDKVAFLSRNFPPVLEGHFGVPLAGAVIVVLNYRLSASEVSSVVNLSEAKVLIVDEGVADLVKPEELPGVKSYVNIRDGRYYDESPKKELPGVDYEEFLSRADDKYFRLELDENELIAIDYTSGSTGLPKGCMYSHRGAYLKALTDVISHSLNAYSVYLWTVPLFHCNGWGFPWATAAVGATNVCMRAPNVDEIWQLIEKEGVTHIGGAPIVFQRLGRFMDDRGIKEFPRVMKLTNAGAPPPESVIQNMESKGAEIIHGYGLTETYGFFTFCEWQPKWDKLTLIERAAMKMRQGVPHLNAGELRVVDAEGKDVPWDGKSIGEVIVRGNDVVQGYYKAPKENEELFKDGWFRTGDGGVIHTDGYLELKDRFKDIIISGGENIVGIAVENCLYQHPDVAEVACYGMPDKQWGEVVKCLITPKPGTSPNAEELISFCRQRIAHYKCPKEIEFGEIPRTSSGKIQKYLLRQRERERLEKSHSQ